MKNIITKIISLANKENIPTLRESSSIEKKILLSVHHKTGSKLLDNIFRAIASQLNLNFMSCNDQNLIGRDWDILIDNHAKFIGLDLNSLTSANYRGIHIIRDPRIVVVSSAFYHCKSTEAWLHLPNKKFGGLTYQQKILSLPNDRARFLFEMNNIAGETINNMVSWEQNKFEWSRTYQLEDLMKDYTLSHFHDLFKFCGFALSDLILCLETSLKKSVFYGYNSPHIRSKTPEPWINYYDDQLTSTFQDIFPNAVESLGYAWDAYEI
jgi:hypothetical protein